MAIKVSLHLKELRKTKWSEYRVRFLFRGAISMVAAMLAERFGPAFGGVFLAFPAIFPASATLVEEHQKKAQAGITATLRGRQSAALDAFGAALSCVGLTGFAVQEMKVEAVERNASHLPPFDKKKSSLQVVIATAYSAQRSCVPLGRIRSCPPVPKCVL
jgi:hypothetical protein